MAVTVDNSFGPVHTPASAPAGADLTAINGLTARDEARVETLQVIVKEETPFLPKVAFGLITAASLGGAVFTGLGLGIEGWGVPIRWLTLWSIALAGGFLVWRLVYLRDRENEVDQARVDALNGSALAHADRVARWVAPVVFLGAPGALVVPHLAFTPLLQLALVVGSFVLAALLAFGVRNRSTAVPAALVVAGLLVGWAYADTGGGWHTWVRLAHLTAFTLWLGGALWNIAVAMPAGREHPYVDAVLAGARQLDRFRWVVRFALPTIIATGLVMADVYRSLPLRWWTTMPGVLIPIKIMAIIALIVVFITCPLFRHCSPVQGVCNVDDLERTPEDADGVPAS
jgi:putative copper resistance protein D